MLKKVILTVEPLGVSALRVFVTVLDMRSTGTPVCRPRKALTTIPASVRVRTFQKELLDTFGILAGPICTAPVL